MMRFSSFFAAIVLTFGLVSSSTAAPVFWNVNSHHYELIPGPGSQTYLSWPDAKAYAESLSYLGVQGHLAVVTSAAEWNFLLDTFDQGNIPPQGAWLGGYQDASAPDYFEPGGGWRWITGEPWSYSAWGGSEPNELNGGEDYLEGVFWGWNDEGQQRRLYVEYETVPELSSTLLLTAAAGAFVFRLARKRRSHSS